MTQTPRELVVFQKATVCVIESASEAAHWPAVREALRAVEDRLPWIRFEFVDETKIERILEHDLSSRYAAIVVTAGAMALKQVRASMERNAASIESALRIGTGILVSVPFLTDSERFDLTFLPKDRQISVIPLSSTRYLKGTLEILGGESAEVNAGLNQQHITRVSINASQSTGWRAFASIANDEENETVSWRSQVGSGRVLVTCVPFERLNAPGILDEVIARISRSRCHLVLGKEYFPRWYLDIPAGSGLAQIAEVNSENSVSLRMFSHLRFTNANCAATWGIDRNALMLRLENDGSIEFPSMDLLGEPIYIRFAGVPRYLHLLRHLEPRLLESATALERGPTFGTLAYGVAVHSASRVVRDEALIPEIMRKSTAQRICYQALRARVHDGHVDKLLLPTVNLFVAAHLVGIDDPALNLMRNWITVNAPLADNDQRAQARWVGRLAPSTGINEVIPASDSALTMVGQLSVEEDRGDLLGFPQTIDSLSPLDLAIISLTLERTSSTSDEFLHLPTFELETMSVGNLETVLYSLSAGLLREDREWLRVGNLLSTAPHDLSGNAQELENDLAAQGVLTARLEASMAILHVEQLQQQMHKLSRAGLPVFGSLMLIVLLFLGVVVSLAWRAQSEIGAASFAVSVLIFGYLCVRVTNTNWLSTVTPRWVKIVPEIFRRSE